MFWIIAFLVLSLIVIVVAFTAPRFQMDTDDLMFIAVIKGGAVLSIVLVLGVCCLICCRMTTGLYRGVSEGQRDGYVVKLSTSGFFFKTWEGQMQMGSGNQAALQSAWHFSVADSKVIAKLNDAMGKRVRMHYTEWFISPAPLIGTTYEVTGVDVLE